VVGIGDFVEIVFGAEVGEAFDFGFLFGSFCEGEDVAKVVIIHGEDQVEVLEVGPGEVAGLALDGNAAMLEDGAHAVVGGISGVVVEGAGGITGDGVC